MIFVYEGITHLRVYLGSFGNIDLSNGLTKLRKIDYNLVKVVD